MDQTKVFSLVTSRRLGKSVGINNSALLKRPGVLQGLDKFVSEDNNDQFYLRALKNA